MLAILKKKIINIHILFIFINFYMSSIAIEAGLVRPPKIRMLCRSISQSVLSFLMLYPVALPHHTIFTTVLFGWRTCTLKSNLLVVLYSKLYKQSSCIGTTVLQQHTLSCSSLNHEENKYHGQNTKRLFFRIDGKYEQNSRFLRVQQKPPQISHEKI